MQKIRMICRRIYPPFVLVYLAWMGWQITHKGGLFSEVFLWLLGIGLVVMFIDPSRHRDQQLPSKRQKGDLRDA